MPYDWPLALLSLDPVKLLHLRRPVLACKYRRKRETVLWLTSGPMTWHCIHCMDQSERASHSYTMVMTANCVCAAREKPCFSVLGVCDLFFAIFHNNSVLFLFYATFQKKKRPTCFHHFFAVTTWCRFYSLFSELNKCFEDYTFWHFWIRGLEDVMGWEGMLMAVGLWRRMF